MRGSTAALAIIAVLAIGVLYISSGGDSSDRSDRTLGKASTDAGRPSQAQDRLSKIRDAYDRRDQADDRSLKDRAAAKKAPVKAMRRELPTRGAQPMRADIDDDDLPYDEDDAEEVDELREVILNDPDPDERVGGILMLSGNEHPDAIATFVRAMADGDAEVRLAAVEALGDYTETLQPNALEPALDDPDPEVRFEAVGIIGDMETSAAYDLVRRALDDPDEDVRALAEGILDLD